jgi:hypothetical protein
MGQVWPWVLLIGLVFLISYDPSTRNLANYFDQERVETDHGSDGAPQEYSSSRNKGM